MKFVDLDTDIVITKKNYHQYKHTHTNTTLII